MDKQIFDLIKEEAIRQNEGIELIASENYASTFVRSACGSILTNKYAEGYPNARYYGGCDIVDKVEMLAIERVCKLFNCKYASAIYLYIKPPLLFKRRAFSNAAIEFLYSPKVKHALPKL